jgi:hypothetical protein
VAVLLALLAALGAWDREGEPEGTAGALSRVDTLGEALALGVRLALGLTLPLPLALGVPLGLLDSRGVGVAEVLAVPPPPPPPLWRSGGEAVEDGEGLGVADLVALAALGVSVGCAVREAEAEAEAVGEAAREEKGLRVVAVERVALAVWEGLPEGEPVVEGEEEAEGERAALALRAAMLRVGRWGVPLGVPLLPPPAPPRPPLRLGEAVPAIVADTKGSTV